MFFKYKSLLYVLMLFGANTWAMDGALSVPDDHFNVIPNCMKHIVEIFPLHTFVISPEMIVLLQSNRVPIEVRGSSLNLQVSEGAMVMRPKDNTEVKGSQYIDICLRPLSIAQRAGNAEIVSLLEQAQAQHSNS